ncbi:hypothetical protein ACLB1Q_20470 [Escherichia coli]
MTLSQLCRRRSRRIQWARDAGALRAWEFRSLTLREIHRFNNGLHSQNGYVAWDVDSLKVPFALD